MELHKVIALLFFLWKRLIILNSLLMLFLQYNCTTQIYHHYGINLKLTKT